MKVGIPPGVAGGLVAAILAVTSALSYAALIFTGDLAGGLHFGITAALLSTAVLSLALMFFGSIRFEIGGASANAAAVIAVGAVAVEHMLAGSASGAKLATVLVGIALSTAVTGSALLLLGLVKAGRWMRFIPYPVIGGVLAAAGWLLAMGSLRVIGNSPAELGAGLALAAILILLVTRFKHALVIPATLAAGAIVFYAVLAALRIPVAQMRSEGWLFTIPGGAALTTPWDPATLHLVSWSVLSQNAGDLVTLIVVSTLATLLGTSGVELATRAEGDLDTELRVHGLSNIVGSLGGALVGNVQLSNTILSFELAGPSRLPPLITALVSVAAIFGGTQIVETIPRFVLGALILTIGYNLLFEWCVRTARRLPLQDYLSILAIVAVVVRFGYVAGVISGLLIGCIIFVVTYSRVRVVKHSLTGVEFRSGVVRSPEETGALQQHGNATHVLVLQGFIFFGMADRLYRATTTLLDSDAEIEFLLLDFRGVSGIDSSAISSFAKMHRRADAQDVKLIFTGMTPQMAHLWDSAGGADARAVGRFEELESALERCENDILHRHAPASRSETSLADWLTEELGDREMTGRLIPYLETRELATSEVLCREGEPALAMYLIERGRVGVLIGLGNGRAHRLRSLGGRTILGEMGLYRSMVRSASVVAEEASRVHILTRDAFLQIEQDDPQLATSFNAAIVRTLADRLEFQNAVVAALQR